MSSRRQPRARSLALIAAAAVAVAAPLGGCGLGAGPTPGGVQLLITREFGARTMRVMHAPAAHGQETVMSLLQRNATVSTRYGGGFVESIDGHSGGYEGPEPIDWFYYVNGVEASKGSAEVNVHAGDRVWWDLHDWNQTDYIPAVVGSYPEPFLHGIDGRRLPVRVECADPEGDPCRTVAAHLRDAGVPAARALLSPAGAGPESLRVLVGTWTQVRGEAGARELEGGPGASGVYARPAASGATIALLDAQGQAVGTLAAGAGLIAATRHAEDAPEWIVTGTDAVGVGLAARAFDEADLRGHFAVALTGAPSGAGASSSTGAPSPSNTGTTTAAGSPAMSVLPLPRPGA
jgi:hypothetical protein